jgi:dATP pyrophosphohydrolase
MSRAQYNILVLLYRWRNEKPEYAVFWRRGGEMCQFIAGGGEEGESPRTAAIREIREETGLAVRAEDLFALDARASLPRSAFSGVDWPDDVYVIPEYAFALHVDEVEIVLCHEHERCEWLEYPEAQAALTWDSNRVALFELHHRLICGGRVEL